MVFKPNLLVAVCSTDDPTLIDQGSSAVVPAIVERHLPGDRVLFTLVPTNDLIIEAEGGCVGVKVKV